MNTMILMNVGQSTQSFTSTKCHLESFKKLFFFSPHFAFFVLEFLTCEHHFQRLPIHRSNSHHPCIPWQPTICLPPNRNRNNWRERKVFLVFFFLGFFFLFLFQLTLQCFRDVTISWLQFRWPSVFRCPCQASSPWLPPRHRRLVPLHETLHQPHLRRSYTKRKHNNEKTIFLAPKPQKRTLSSDRRPCSGQWGCTSLWAVCRLLVWALEPWQLVLESFPNFRLVAAKKTRLKSDKETVGVCYLITFQQLQNQIGILHNSSFVH